MTEFNLSKRLEEIEDEIDNSYKGQEVTFEDVYNSPEWIAVQRIRWDIKEFIKELKKDTGCQPINSREKQIVALFKERIDELAGELLK